MNIKKTLKTTGKVAASVIAPPVGFALFPKGVKDRAVAAMSGAVVSFLASLGIMEFSQGQRITPEMLNFESAPTSKHVLTVMTSPLAYALTSVPYTEISQGNENLYATNKGDAPIQFKDGKYHLNFTQKTIISEGKKIFSNRFSLSDSQEKVSDLEKQLSQEVSQGNIMQARELEGKLRDARNSLTETKTKYNETRAIYQEAVNSLNAELETFHQSTEDKPYELTTQQSE